MKTIMNISSSDTLQNRPDQSIKTIRKDASGDVPKAASEDLKEKAPELEQLRKAKEEKVVQTIDRKVSLSVNSATGDVVFTVINTKTGEIVRQIPPEEMRDQLNAQMESLQGNLLNRTV